MSITRAEILDFSEQKKIGPYRLISPDRGEKIKPLGEGGSGVVYLAEQSLSADVIIRRAIKFFVYRDDIAGLSGEYASKPISTKNFNVEIINFSTLNHENVMKVVEAGFWESPIKLQVPYLVTELIDGPNLRTIIEGHRLSAMLQGDHEQVVDLLIQLFRGSSYLHERKFFHCDLAPKNLFLDGSAPHIRLVIGDLGTGRTVTLAPSESFVLVGTPSYTPSDIKSRFNTEVTAQHLASMQPRWDLFAATQIAEEMLVSLEEGDHGSPPWATALLRNLQDAHSGKRFTEADHVLRMLAWIRPSQQRLGEIEELTESYPGTKQFLMPVEPASTSKRVRRLIRHRAFVRLNNVPQLLMASAVFSGGNHTRYEHSIGTYQVVRKYLLALLNDDEFLSHFSQKHLELALLAGLLSSITRFPLSFVVHEVKSEVEGSYAQFSRESIFDEIMG